MVVSWGEDARALTPAVTSLGGPSLGSYPSGNTLMIQGSSETVVIDPSVTVVEKGGVPLDVDAVINSHGHEDHVAGNGMFPDARIHIHEADISVAHDLEGLLTVFGYNTAEHPEMALHFQEQFHYTPRPDATGFHDGHVWDLGGVTVEAVPLPGHTAGHSGFRISGGVFYISDIDLSGFGPYYGDIWSSLDDFERSMEIVREEDARFYVTFHHKGIIEDRATFLEMLDGFAAVIPRRHAAMVEFLSEPRTVDDMVARRFVYRPSDDVVFAENVERRTAELHLDRMLERGEAAELEPGLYRAT